MLNSSVDSNFQVFFFKYSIGPSCVRYYAGRLVIEERKCYNYEDQLYYDENN
jgi:hypothetical protein